MKNKEQLKTATARRIATARANKEKARNAANDKLNAVMDWALFEVQDNAKVNGSANGGRWVEVWVYVTEEEMKS